MNSQRIPDNVRRQADEIVRRFNVSALKDPDRGYVTRYRGQYMYLDRQDYGDPSHICRLNYTGSMDHWGFAIYKYSDEKYDPDEFVFPGYEHLDGTIEGAMKAGLEAYPMRELGPEPELGSVLRLLRGLLRRG